MQGLLLLRRNFDFLHPGGLGTQTFLQARLDFLAQRRVAQHGLMGGKDVADAGDLTLIDQRADLRMDLVQRRIQPLQFDHRRLAELGIVDHLRLAYQDRTDGDAGRGGDADDLLAGPQDGHVLGCLIQLHGPLLRRRPAGRQRLDFLAQPFFHRADQRRQRIVGDRGFGDELQHLAAMRAHRQQFAQTLGRYPGALTASQPHTDFSIEGLSDFGQYLGRTRMQTMGVSQWHLGTRPVCRHFAAQGFEHCATGRRLAQLLPAAFDQQIAQALEHRPMRFAQAGQHEKTIERLPLMLEMGSWRDEGETRTLHRLLATQPPEAIPQRQRLAKRQTGVETRLHALRALEQLDALPCQLVEIIRSDTQRDQLAIQR